VWIVAGPDGALWFTESAGNKIGRITTGGVFTEYPLSRSNSTPWDITWGPGQALWFTQERSLQIGAIGVAGRISEIALPLSPWDLTRGRMA
jgi:virginiamycin B lyase